MNPRPIPDCATRSHGLRAVDAWVALLVALPLMSSCISLTADPRALVMQPNGDIRALSLVCPTSPVVAQAPPAAALDSLAIRIVTWNLHKEGDAGWDRDLATFANDQDLVLLQEATLQPSLRDILRFANLRWVMASSFAYGNYDIGVLTAAHVAPVTNCTQRVVEPLLRLPKSAVISWFALTGTSRTLAVVNVHAINFSLSIGAYRAQFAALGDALAKHAGPIVLAGDLNTWSAARTAAVVEVTTRLGLTEVKFAEDKRTLFFGNQLDHIFVRGLRVLDSAAIAVKTSDHNPVTATLQLADP